MTVSDDLAHQTKLLETLAEFNRSMATLSRICRNRVEVAEASRGLEIMTYSGVSHFDAYVDVELHNGTSFSWVMNIAATLDSWKIDGSIRKNTNDGQEDVVEFMEADCVSFDGLSAVLLRLADQMIRSAETFTF